MRKAVLALLLAGAAASPAAPGEADKLAALARLYGVVRWFHPTDAAQEIDWNRFAVRAAKAVRGARTTPELERALEDLFAPVASGIVIDAQLPAPASAPASERLVAWRHLGLGFGSDGGGPYYSARTGRRAPAEIDGFASLVQSMPAGSLRGKTVRLTGQVKAESRTEAGAAALWLRVDRGGDERGFVDHMDDRPIRAPEWREYVVEGVVAADAVQLAFGVLARGPVRAGFDTLRLSVRQDDGSWQPVTVVNPGFEADGGWRHVGTSRRVVVSYPQDAAPEGRRWLSLAPPGSNDQPLFEAPLRAGAHTDLDLGLGLRARVPLVLGEADADVSAAQRPLLDALKAELAGLPEAGGAPGVDPDVRAADVIVAWSVFRHFYPYWADTGIDWDARLLPLLEGAGAAATRPAHQDALRRLVAEVRDGHGSVTDGAGSPLAWLPVSVRWLEGRLVVEGSRVPEQVRVGTVITAVDGRPAAAWFAEQEALQSGSPQWRASRAAVALARGPEGSRVALELEREGPPAKVALVRDQREPARETRPAAVTPLQPGVFYVDLERADWNALQPLLGELAQAQAVVFDMRGYPSDSGAKIVRHLLAAPETARWMHVPRIVQPFGRMAEWKDAGWDLSPAAPRIAGKVAFLTDARAISYAESVMGYVEGLELGAIVGGPTAGTNGNVNTFTVPSGMKVRFTGMRVTRHDGTAFHLAGVRPTVPVEPTVAGIRAGRDEVLERALATVAAPAPAASPAPAAVRPLLVTVDDLPLAGRAPAAPAERRRLVEAHLAALAAHGIRAVGLVTWSNVSGPEDLDLLRLWLAAGHELGNHSDRHLSYTTTDFPAYRADVDRARVQLQALLAPSGAKLRFFRFPFLREGETVEKLDAMRRYLAESDQRNLPVTIDNQDWSFDAPWQEAGREGQGARQAEVAADYLASLRLAVRHHQRRGDRLLGRPAPQVLLLHANSIGAAQWPALFAWLAASGNRFATADEVLSDPVFTNDEAQLPGLPASHGYGLWDRLRQVRAEAEARAQVAALLQAQAESWTGGDLEAFCAVYADDALFLSSSGTTQGRAAVLARYRQRYPDKAAMGALTLEVMEARALSGVEATPAGDAVPGGVHAVAVAARWTLRFAGKDPATGLTSLVLHRLAAGWRIVQDASF